MRIVTGITNASQPETIANWNEQPMATAAATVPERTRHSVIRQRRINITHPAEFLEKQRMWGKAGIVLRVFSPSVQKHSGIIPSEPSGSHGMNGNNKMLTAYMVSISAKSLRVCQKRQRPTKGMMCLFKMNLNRARVARVTENEADFRRSRTTQWRITSNGPRTATGRPPSGC